MGQFLYAFKHQPAAIMSGVWRCRCDGLSMHYSDIW